MLELKDFMPINFLKKEKFTGSHKGLRFRMEKLEENEETFLFVSVWPEPYSYDFTPEDVKLIDYETHEQIKNIPVAV